MRRVNVYDGTMTNTTRTAEIAAAREADTRIAAAWAAYYEVADKAKTLRSEARRLRKNLGHFAANVAASRTKRADEYDARAEAIDAEALPLREAAVELDRELYKGWTRFYLVEHIHNTAHCSSFRPTTRVGWLPDVSGLTEAEAVAEHGATLCSICFPSAPVELTTKPADPETCSGSGKPIPADLPKRRGFAAGNWVTCPDCGAKVGTPNNAYRIRKHKRA
ncbi:hypothetical protein SEA_ZETA1847_60 [Microbacterium phage Zeta1847]|uniref:Uncharacterized protein n=1 Tax=Microbacterium phage Zeta1847 TaxID=2201444 RepID=A0A2Z4Q9K3_9CAUD|nr:hypothetical protein HOT46_gp60 [Microbacterium phage Zeta1847]AWY06694.1 hypothetical protein SEA_ZETA1847_60 [Microbacterium phage Zeta1847]